MTVRSSKTQSPSTDEGAPQLSVPDTARLLEGVLALGRDVHLGLSPADLAERFLSGVRDMFSGRLVAIRLMAGDADNVTAFVSSGASLRRSAERGPFVLKRTSLAKTQLKAESIDSGRVDLVDNNWPVFKRSKVSFSIPLVAGGDLYGVLDVGYQEGVDLSEQDERLIIPIANYLAVALRNVQLHAEASLLRDYLGKVIEHADALILGVDANWRVTVFNRAIANLTGISHNKIVGSDVRDWLSPVERSRLTTAIATVMAGKPSVSVEVDLAAGKSESVRTVWNVASIRAADKVEAVVAVGQDVTRIRSLEEQVIHAEKLATLGQLAAGVVHELNNPLTSIVAYSDYLVKKFQQGEPMEKSDVDKMQRILQGAERIHNFTRDLVEYAKPAEENLDRVAINDVIRQGMSFCEHLFSEPNVELVRDLADDLPLLLGVRGQLVQVVINLLTNAVHALDGGGGQVRVRTFRRSQRHVAVMIEDSGMGINPEDIDRIFEPFFTTKTSGQGTGLGLSIIRNIVERHQGSITVDSDPGHGAVFTIVLAVAK